MNIYLTDYNPKIKAILHYADNVLVLSQRLSEWCGHGPILEQDIALTNIALDLLGQARLYYQYAAEITGKTEDDFAFMRDDRSYLNSLLVEQPNGNWGDTIVRQFFFDQYHILLLEELIQSEDSQLSEIAEKSLKEVRYHVKYSSEWVIRLGDGTPESHDKIQSAVNNLYRFSKDNFMMTSTDQELIKSNIIPDMASKWEVYRNNILQVLNEATITLPEIKYYQLGGKEGKHTEYLGYILSELQFLQRSYPGLEW